MISYLRARWEEHDTEYAAINGADEFVPCLAHIIHNVVLKFLQKMSATPSNSNDIYESSEPVGDATAKRTRSTGSGRTKDYGFLQRHRGFALTAAKLREIAKASSNSAVRAESFQKIVKEKLGIHLKLKLDVKTRWHSTATMLERALRLRDAINTWLVDYPELEPLQMTDANWAQVEIILSVLTPFWQCALQLMNSRGVNIHLTYSAYQYMFNHIEDFKSQLRKNRTGRKTAHLTQILRGLKAAWKLLTKYYSKSDSTTTYYAAQFFTPFLKDKLFETKQWEVERGEVPWKDVYREKLHLRYARHYRNSRVCDNVNSERSEGAIGSHSRTPSETVALGGSIMENIFADQDEEEAIDPALLMADVDELELYLNEPRHLRDRTKSESQAILEYWKQHEPIWPRLALMVRDVLAVPASGIDVEQLFSQGRNTISNHRHRLSEQTISDIMVYRTAAKRKRVQAERDIEEGYSRWAELKSIKDDILTESTLSKNNPNLKKTRLGTQLFKDERALNVVLSRLDNASGELQDEPAEDVDEDDDSSAVSSDEEGEDGQAIGSI